MNYQWLPFCTLLLIFLLNLLLKRTFFCVSSLILGYITTAFGMAIYMASNPHYGVTFIYPEAMVYLSFCMCIFSLPAIFFRDGKKQRPLFLISQQRALKIARRLIWITVPAAMFFLLRSIPLLLKFLRGGLGRDEFRGGLDIAGMGGMASPHVFFFTLCACFASCALFFAIFGLSLKYFKRKYIFWLLFGGLAFAFDTLKTASRSVLFNNMMFVFVLVMIILPTISQEERTRVKKYIGKFAIIALLPFAYITVKRFDGEIFYSLVTYFATGPYSFNADYLARSIGAPCTYGYITSSLPAFLCDLFFRTKYQALGNMAVVEEYSDGLSMTQDIYYDISLTFCGEFKTVIGSFLLDFSKPVATTIIIIFSIVFIIFFRKQRYCTMSMMFVAAFYFTILALSPIGWPFVGKNNGLLLLFSFIMVMVLRKAERQELRNIRNKSDKSAPKPDKNLQSDESNGIL